MSGAVCSPSLASMPPCQKMTKFEVLGDRGSLVQEFPGNFAIFRWISSPCRKRAEAKGDRQQKSGPKCQKQSDKMVNKRWPKQKKRSDLSPFACPFLLRALFCGTVILGVILAPLFHDFFGVFSRRGLFCGAWSRLF